MADTPQLPVWLPPVTPADDLNDKPDLREILLNVAATDAVIPVVYGTAQIGGKIFALTFTAGKWTLGALLCHGEVTIDSVLLNGEAPVSGVTVNEYTGTAIQTYDPLLAAAISGYTDDLENIAYVVVQYENDHYAGKPEITATVTSSISNPAAALADLIENTTYGAGGAVNSASQTAAETACSTTLGSPAQARREIGLAVTDARSIRSWIDTLAAYAGCWAFKRGAEWILLPDRPRSSDATLTASHVVMGSLQFRVADRSAAPTEVEVVYTDTSVTPWRARSAIYTLPAATEIRRSTVSMPGIKRYAQAYREAIERCKKLQRNLEMTCTLFDDHLGLELGDVVTVTHPYGVTSKTFRIISEPRIAYNGRVTIECREYSASDYSDATDAAPTLGGEGSVGVDQSKYASAVEGSFAAWRYWHFKTDMMGWDANASGATCVWNFYGLSLNVTASAATVYIETNGVSMDGGTFSGYVYPVLRLRIWRFGGTSWNGRVYYANENHGISESYYKDIPDVFGTSSYTTWDMDMRALTAGGTDWTDSDAISKIRIRFTDGATASVDEWDIDFIAVGRYALPEAQQTEYVPGELPDWWQNGEIPTDINTAIDNLASRVTDLENTHHFVRADEITPRQTGGCGALAVLAGGSNQPDLPYLPFDATTSEAAEFYLRKPDFWGSSITFVPYWSHPATATNFGVTWKLRALAVGNDDPIPGTYGTAQSSVDTGGTTDDLYLGPESSAITIAGTPADADLILCQIYRDPADAGDTMAVDARLHGVKLKAYTTAPADPPDPYEMDIPDANLLLLIPFTDTGAPVADGYSLDVLTSGPRSITVSGASRSTTYYKFSMGASWTPDSTNGYMRLDADGNAEANHWEMPNSLVYGTAYTHEIWIRPSALEAYDQCIFAVRDSVYTNYLSPYQVAMRVDLTSAGRISVNYSNNDGGSVNGGSGGTWNGRTTDTGPTVQAGEWTHIRLVVSSGVLRIYINGIAALSSPSAIPTGVTVGQARANLWFGNVWVYDASENHRFTGHLQDYRACTLALNSGNFVPPTAPFTYPQ